MPERSQLRPADAAAQLDGLAGTASFDDVDAVLAGALPADVLAAYVRWLHRVLAAPNGPPPVGGAPDA